MLSFLLILIQQLLIVGSKILLLLYFAGIARVNFIACYYMQMGCRISLDSTQSGLFKSHIFLHWVALLEGVWPSKAILTIGHSGAASQGAKQWSAPGGASGEGRPGR